MTSADPVTSAAPARVGMIVPSSNTALETEVAGLALAPQSVTVHVARVRVTAVSLDDRSTAQFDVAPMVSAGLLLADAGLDALLWAGTSGSWLGVAHDQALAAALASSTGVASSTSTLALLEACRSLGVTRVALVTPYLPEVVDRIRETYAGQGIEVVCEGHLGILSNHAFGLVTPDRIVSLALGCDPVASGAQAVLVACTNLRGTGVVDRLEDLLGIPVLDSIAVTFWQALTLAGAITPGSSPRPNRVPAGISANGIPTRKGGS